LWKGDDRDFSVNQNMTKIGEAIFIAPGHHGFIVPVSPYDPFDTSRKKRRRRKKNGDSIRFSPTPGIDPVSVKSLIQNDHNPALS
jgi:hypothetical protein